MIVTGLLIILLAGFGLLTMDDIKSGGISDSLKKDLAKRDMPSRKTGLKKTVHKDWYAQLDLPENFTDKEMKDLKEFMDLRRDVKEYEEPREHLVPIATPATLDSILRAIYETKDCKIRE